MINSKPRERKMSERKTEEEQQSKNSCSKLDTGKSERSVWLMKCPVAVSNSCKSAVDYQPLSPVVVSLDPLRPELPSILYAPNFPRSSPPRISLFPSVHNEDGWQWTGKHAKKLLFKYVQRLCSDERFLLSKPSYYEQFDYFCYCQQIEHGIHLFLSALVNVGKVAIEGKVEHKFDMKPDNENMEEYRKMFRERTNKSMIKNRQIQVIDNDRGVLVRPMPGVIGLIASNSSKAKRKATPVKGSDVRRSRSDHGELEDIMFKLFERQPNWTLKQLVQETDQPAQFLKEILTELCVYNKRGTNQGTYELKPEYKKTVKDTGAE